MLLIVDDLEIRGILNGKLFTFELPSLYNFRQCFAKFSELAKDRYRFRRCLVPDLIGK